MLVPGERLVKLEILQFRSTVTGLDMKLFIFHIQTDDKQVCNNFRDNFC